MSGLIIATIAFIIHSIVVIVLYFSIRNADVTDIKGWKETLKCWREIQDNSEKILFIAYIFLPYISRRLALAFLAVYTAAGYTCIGAMASSDLPGIFREIRMILLDFYNWVSGLKRIGR